MLAVDFGTSAVRAVVVTEAGVSRVNFDGDAELPAAVYFPPGEARPTVGLAAEKMGVVDPDRVVRGAKRLLGQSFVDVDARALGRRMPHALSATATGEAALDVGGVGRGACEISAWLFRAIAERCPQESEVVLAVPSVFGCAQRQAACDAASAAGLRVVRLVSEPVAAAVARLPEDGHFLVCDLGAGVADIAVVARHGRVVELIASSADIGWGGDDLDAVIARQLIADASAASSADLKGDWQVWGRLFAEARRLKHELAEREETRLFIPVVVELDDGSTVDIDRVVSRAQLDEWLEPLARRLELPCHDVLASASLALEDLDGALICGGAVREPVVLSTLRRFLGAEVEPCGEQGSAVLDGLVEIARARLGLGERPIIVDSLPESLGLSSGGVYSPVVASGTRVPVRMHKLIEVAEESGASVVLSLCSGESADPSHNRVIGQYVCEGVAERSSGQVVIELSVSVDENGLLFVMASNMVTGEPLSIRRSGGPGLTRRRLRALSMELGSTSELPP